MRRTSRNSFSFPDFSLRRLLLQGARAARGSPQLGTRLCDIEKGGKPSSSHSNKHNSDSTSQHSGSSPGGGVVDRTSSCKLTPNSQKSTTNNNGSTKTKAEECPLCYYNVSSEEFHSLLACKHFACRDCLENYLKIEISESRTDISCPQCSEPMHPTDIQDILKSSPQTMAKYEDFMVRRVLIADPDTRWCPAPDCSYAVIATGCASCPRIKCERPGCDVNFCYHCKATWHPDQTCDAARASRQSPTRAPSGSISQDSQHSKYKKDDIKPCPRCQVLIVKMDDGSCNHMVCAICGSEFCWLCMKEISDLHYLSPSGCTFWGKKPWSRKKKLLWQLGTLVGAPLGIALVAGIAVPAMIIGIPVWVGKKIHTRYSSSGKHKRNCAVLGGVTASVVISPVLAGLAIAIGVPILLFYVYGVVPVSLCRAGCGDKVKFEFDEEEDNGSRNHDAASVDAVSRIGATSIGEVSLSVASGSHLGVLSQHSTYTVANPSTTALAGSITGHRLEVQVDVSTSETASAVTCVSEKSGITINDSASTKALAGSISSQYRQHNEPNFSEDGVSEKETGADKASLCSGRSFRSSERSFREELDSNSVSSSHKRNIFGQRIPKSQRTVSLDSTTGSNNIPENEPETPGNSVTASPQATGHENDLKLHLPIEEQLPKIQENAAESPMRSIEEEQNAKGGSPAIKPNDDTDSPKPVESKSVTKTNILRNLFFFQNETGESSASKSTTT